MGRTFLATFVAVSAIIGCTGGCIGSLVLEADISVGRGYPIHYEKQVVKWEMKNDGSIRVV